MSRMLASFVLFQFMLTALPVAAAPVQMSGVDIKGRSIRLEEGRGRVIAITFASRFTGSEAEQVNKSLMQEASPAVGMVSIVDFVGIPALFFGMARDIIASWSPKTPARLVIDEQSSWSSALGAAPDKRVDILVLDRDGELRGHFVGVGQVEAARRLIHELTAAPRLAAAG